MRTLVKPPIWFWVVGVVLLLWGLIGFAGFVFDRMMTPEMLAQMSDYDRQFRAAQPGWNVVAYGVATLTGLLGTVALLARRRAATPLYVVSLIFVVLLLWGLIGFAGFVVDRMMTPEMLAQMSDYDRQFRAAQPGWNVLAYGVATLTGLLGTVALLARRRAATPLCVVSLIFVVLLFGYVLGATYIIAVKGLVTAAGLPVVIALIALLEIWLARHATRRGWIA